MISGAPIRVICSHTGLNRSYQSECDVLGVANPINNIKKIWEKQFFRREDQGMADVSVAGPVKKACARFQG